jgi:hypothetical protein
MSEVLKGRAHPLPGINAGASRAPCFLVMPLQRLVATILNRVRLHPPVGQKGQRAGYDRWASCLHRRLPCLPVVCMTSFAPDIYHKLCYLALLQLHVASLFIGSYGCSNARLARIW